MTRQAVVLPVVLWLAGCGGADDRSVHRAGQRVGESLTEFAKGVGSGVDRQLEVPVELSEEVAQLGLQTTVAKGSGLDGRGEKSISVYFIAGQPVKTWLLTKALNAEGQEVGRSTVELELDADEAKYVTFAFDAEMDSQRVGKYVVGIGKPAPAKQEEPAKEPDAGGLDGGI